MKLIPELKPGDNILSAEFREVFNELVRRVNMQIVGDDDQISVDVIPDIAYMVRGIKQPEEPDYVEVIKAGTLEFTFDVESCEVVATYESVKVLKSSIPEDA